MRISEIDFRFQKGWLGAESGERAPLARSPLSWPWRDLACAAAVLLFWNCVVSLILLIFS